MEHDHGDAGSISCRVVGAGDEFLDPGLGLRVAAATSVVVPGGFGDCDFFGGHSVGGWSVEETGAGFRIAPEKPRPNVNYTLPVAALCPRPPEIFLKQQL